jgi:uncharacterized protein YbaA (DUF1428 family)
MTYVDGFVIPIPKKNVETYKKLARKASKVWMDHGALEYRECIGDDLAGGPGMRPFGEPLEAKPSETVVFAWIVYRSRAHRDRVNKKVMADPRIAKMAPKDVPFDHTRMLYGGFKTVVKA